ncbi:hypothetical protein QZH41_013155 [Actinostola sp. cb2023]|nr:hypothetical protein QZH41_013155 [Actinostola sp. cb2023]
MQSNQYSNIHVVLGNEACDLDSVVSAIVYAYCLHKMTTEECKTGISKPVIPVLNIPREDYRLRTEITYTMERFGVHSTDLTFINEIDLKAMKDHGKLSVTLVDHNIIPVHQAFLNDVLVEIIDHHKDEIPSSPNYSKTIELVGSCSTLVAEKVLRIAPDVLDAQATSLLLAAILLDTINLDPRAGRMTEKDVAIVDQLKKCLKSDITSDELYLAVSRGKFG